jgi:hypothetical protein
MVEIIQVCIKERLKSKENLTVKSDVLDAVTTVVRMSTAVYTEARSQGKGNRQNTGGGWMKEEIKEQVIYPLKTALSCEVCVNRDAQLIDSRLCTQCLSGKKINFKLVSDRVLKGLGYEKKDGKVFRTIN